MLKASWHPARLFPPLRSHSVPFTTTHARSPESPFRLAVIGSGPAGFYTAYRVMNKLSHAMVDMYESLPVPYGLVRYGVAPDHPEVKHCQEKFEEVASSSRFRFIGNTAVGLAKCSGTQCTVRLQTLLHHYDSVLFAYGASEDRKLDIPGETTLEGIHSARQFVGWYNGLPECSGLDPAIFGTENAVIIGQGNVALDIARILLQDIDALRKTDIAEHALAQLSKNRIRRVYVVGRRGPVQAAFTVKEVRELMKLPGVTFHPVERELVPLDLKTLPRASKRLMEVILRGSLARTVDSVKSWSLDHCLSPIHFLGDTRCPRKVASTEFNVMKLHDAFNPASRSEPTGATVTLPSGIVFRSVGYKSAPLSGFANAGIQFDETRGVVNNDGLGRVTQLHSDGNSAYSRRVPGMYCAGWVKNGPTGVLAATMQDAFTTGEAMVQDWISGAEFLRPKVTARPQGWDGIRKDADVRAELTISWKQWLQIDKAEMTAGKEQGRERKKFTTTEDMLAVVQ